MDSYLLIFLIILLIFVIIIIIYNFNRTELVKDSFSNLYTNSNCCNQNEIANCETYGKTGVCNYYKNDNSCMCQNSF